MKIVVQEFQFEIYRYSQIPIASYHSIYKSTGTFCPINQVWHVLLGNLSVWLSVLGLHIKTVLKHAFTYDSDRLF